MTIYTIKGETPKTRNYTPSTFYVNKYFGGDDFIACENDEIGFMVRDDLTMNKLQAHLKRMRKEGFTVTEMTI